MLRRWSWLLALPLLSACGDSEPDTPPDDRLLHVASPDWQDQIIYFVFTDRFFNGDPSNDDQGAGEYDPEDFRKYSGGDLQGIIDKLDYIQGTGATAVWITPPVANQWWDPRAEFGGFHGYWARDLKSVDEHQGDLDLYKQLSHELHTRGMYLVQDIVPNHMGNFFSYDGAYDPADPTANFVLNTETVPTDRPVGAPFDQIDVTDPAQREAAIYHFTPGISDFLDPTQETTYALSDLDDLNTENPVVQDALRDAYGMWIREVGVDGVRIDTVKFIEAPFWPKFLHGDGGASPGLEEVAAQTGRDGFLTFGEIFETSEPFMDAGERKMSRFLGTPAAPALDAVLAFPLYDSIKRVLTEGRPSAELAHRIALAQDTDLFPNPELNPTFLDNHDVARFLASSDEAGLRQALLLLMTLPGIPVVYQGTAQLFETPRGSMFRGGWGDRGRDHFVPARPLYMYLGEIAELRKAHRVLTRGAVEVLRSNVAGPGALAYTRRLGDDVALILHNTSVRTILLDDVTLDLPAGTVLARATGTADHPDIVVSEDGRVLTELSPKAALLFITNGATDTPPAPGGTVTLASNLDGQRFTADIPVRGTATGAQTVKAVIDDDLEGALDIAVAADGTFTASITLDAFAYGESTHAVTIYAPDASAASTRSTFTVDRVFDGVVVEEADPAGDDDGPDGSYGYPGDPTFGSQMDILNVRIEAGSSLTIRLQMAELSTVWAPANGFDHVSFTIFVDLPGQDGLTVLPRLDGEAPMGFEWDRMHFAFGWANRVHTTENATADETGTALMAAPEISVDPQAKTISFAYPSDAFGISDFTGARVWITTWDYDGLDDKYRDLLPEGGDYAMQGPADGVKIMDDAGPFTIPAN